MKQKLRCPRCGWTWKYSGKKKDGITSCPRCHTTMSIKLAKKRARGEKISKDWKTPKWWRKEVKNVA